jgi:hypothetical protein
MRTIKYYDIYVTNSAIYVPFGAIKKRKLLEQFQEAVKDATNLSLNSSGTDKLLAFLFNS